MTSEAEDATVLDVPPDKLRITASYPTGGAGQPENVEITINDGLPDGPAELAAFVTTLTDTLFRTETGHPRSGADVHVTGDALHPERIRGSLSLLNSEQLR